MKNDLLTLIQNTEHIKDNFHSSGGGGFPQLNVIYNTPDFCNWSQELQLELQNIFDRTNDNFIWSLLVLLKQGFNGWKDEHSFNKLYGGLSAIEKNIDRYYETEHTLKDMEELNMPQKTPKIFISHSSKDIAYVEAIVNLLEDIGLNETQIFCSSVAGYGIPLDNDIFDYLRQQFENHELHVILLLSENYYNSVPCMNEMGAAWVLQSQYTTILLPGFEFKEIKGAINPRKIALKLDSAVEEQKEKLGQLKDILINEFQLTKITDVRWERKRTDFLEAISHRKAPCLVSDLAQQLLLQASDDPEGVIIKSVTLGGTSITAGNAEFVKSQERKEVAKCEQAISELVDTALIEPRGKKGEIFVITAIGYEYIDQLKK